MMRLNQEEVIEEEPRYDSDTVQKAAALATRLQQEHQETMTAGQVEELGVDVGLEPAFIRQALARLTTKRKQKNRQALAVEEAGSTAEFRSLLATFAIPLVWGTLAYLSRGSLEVARFVTMVASLPLACLIGFLSGKKRVGLVAALLLMAALAPTFFDMAVQEWFRANPAFNHPEFISSAEYNARWQLNQVFLPYGLLGGLLGMVGAWTRKRYFPFSSAKPSAKQSVSRPELLDLLFTLQVRLEGEKQQRAFLSVDVAGSTEMKRSGPELTVEYSFSQYRQWVEAVAQECDGEMQMAAGDGVMCLFPTEMQAVRAARRLQEGLPRFNAAQNRLSLPFRIRCGVSAGEVPITEGTPIGHLQSPVIDRAAALQKQATPGDIVVSSEVTAAALVELGALAPLPQPVNGEPAFSWHAGLPPNTEHPTPNT